MNPAAETVRGTPRVSVQFDRPDRRYRPHDTVAVRYAIDGVATDRLRAVECSMLWYTEGKGEEDMRVHFFAPAAPTTTGGFSAELPASPLSYEGIIVKLRWCVRVRLFFPDARDFVSEHVFDVGEIPPARMPRPA